MPTSIVFWVTAPVAAFLCIAAVVNTLSLLVVCLVAIHKDGTAALGPIIKAWPRASMSLPTPRKRDQS